MEHPTYAGFLTRFVALFIDGIILLIPAIILGFATSGLGSVVVYFLYKTVWECSKTQATPGKRAMGIMVVTKEGQQLDFRTSAIRSVVSFLSSSCMFLGHFVALFTDKNQTVHDLIAETLVVQGENSAPLLDSWMEAAREIFGSKSSSKNI